MTDISPEQPNPADQIGTVEDCFATVDLLQTYQAFNYQVKADEIYTKMIPTYEAVSRSSYRLNPGFAAASLIMMGRNAFRERRALYYYETGKCILREIDKRNGHI